MMLDDNEVRLVRDALLVYSKHLARQTVGMVGIELGLPDVDAAKQTIRTNANLLDAVCRLEEKIERFGLDAE